MDKDDEREKVREKLEEVFGLLRGARELYEDEKVMDDLSMAMERLNERRKREQNTIAKWLKEHNNKEEIKNLIKLCVSKEMFEGLMSVINEKVEIHMLIEIKEELPEFLEKFKKVR